MLFDREERVGIVEGRITMTYRRWTRPQAKPGGHYRLGTAGVIVAKDVDRVPATLVTDAEAFACGFANREMLLKFLGAPPPEELLTRVRFHFEATPDHRHILGALSPDPAGIEDLRRRLAGMDARRPEPWTRAVLEAIEQRPGERAANLAATFARETLAFKADVRRLKALDLTTSLEVGYELTARGSTYLAATPREV